MLPLKTSVDSKIRKMPFIPAPPGWAFWHVLVKIIVELFSLE
jgi:hypothetical protein